MNAAPKRSCGQLLGLVSIHLFGEEPAHHCKYLARQTTASPALHCRTREQPRRKRFPENGHPLQLNPAASPPASFPCPPHSPSTPSRPRRTLSSRWAPTPGNRDKKKRGPTSRRECLYRVPEAGEPAKHAEITFSSSIAYAAPSRAARLCAAETTMRTLASPTGTTPVRCAIATFFAPSTSRTCLHIFSSTTPACNGVFSAFSRLCSFREVAFLPVAPSARMPRTPVASRVGPQTCP